MRRVYGLCMLFCGLLLITDMSRASITPMQWASFKRHHSLVLVYSARCPFCKRFIPVVHTFLSNRDWVGVAFTLDEPSPLWPDVERITPVLKTRWFGQSVTVPALFLYSDRGKLYPVSVGYLNQSQLAQRLNQLIPRMIAHEGVSR